MLGQRKVKKKHFKSRKLNAVTKLVIQKNYIKISLLTVQTAKSFDKT